MTSTSRTDPRRPDPQRTDQHPESVRPCVGLLSGQWTPHDQLRLSIDDVGFRHGATAVERMRTYGGHVFHLHEHLDRWQQTIGEIGIEGLPSRTATAVLTDALLSRNEAFVDAVGDCGITLFATPGLAGGGSPTFCMHLNVLDHERIARRREQGQPIVLTSVSQPPASCWPRSIKVRCRLHYYLADQIAAEQHAGAVGVLVDQDGSLTETSIANLAIVESGRIVSPCRERVLGGVTQKVVERIAKGLSIEWGHTNISARRLSAADEVLLMGTDGGLWFARCVSQEAGKSWHGAGKSLASNRSAVGGPSASSAQLISSAQSISGDRLTSSEQPGSGGQPGEIYRRLLAQFDDLTG